jgi:hypothetical protein
MKGKKEGREEGRLKGKGRRRIEKLNKQQQQHYMHE